MTAVMLFVGARVVRLGRYRDKAMRRRLKEAVYEKPRIVDIISVSVGRPSWLDLHKAALRGGRLAGPFPDRGEKS